MISPAVAPVAGLLGLAIALGLVYRPAVRSLWREWMSYESSFGLVVVAIAGYMATQGVKRLRHARVPLRPSLLPGLVVSLLGNTLYLFGSVSGTQMLQQVSLVVTIFGTVWLLTGTAYLRVLWVPLSYLVFALQLPGELLLRFSSQLQHAAAWIAAQCLALTGMPVVHRGQLLELPHITLEVARECSGVNHIVALMSLAIPLAYLSNASVFRKVFVAVFAFFLGVALNGIRVAMIGWWSAGHQELHGPVSTLFVSFIFFAGLIILSALIRVSFSRKPAPLPPAEQTAERLVGPSDAGTARKALAAFWLAVVLVIMTGGMRQWYTAEPVSLTPGLQAFPEKIGAWVGEDAPGALPLLKRYAPDSVIERVYRNGTDPGVTVYVGYFAQQTQGHEAVAYALGRYHQQAVVAPLVDSLNVNRLADRSATPDQIVYFWYDINGRVVTDRYHAKWSTAVDWLLRRRTNAALVVIALERAAASPEAMTVGQRWFVSESLPLIRGLLRS